MDREKIDLIIHPVRFRIMQTLAGEELTTQALSELLDDVPTSSIYRHLRELHAGEMVEVVATRPVRGTRERVYRLVQPPRLTPDDMAGLTADEHLRYFTIYVMTLIQGFADYLDATAVEEEFPDLLADRVGYTEAVFYASTEELDRVGQALNDALAPLLNNQSGNGRGKHKIAFISHPVKGPSAGVSEDAGGE